MQVKAIVNEKYEETEIHVCNHEADDVLRELVKDISAFVNQDILAQAQNGDRTMLNQKDVISFYSEGQRVMAKTVSGSFVVYKKLYELEQELDEKQFTRISKSEIINIQKIKKLDMSLAGTIRVIMKDGSESYTSRRNVAKLKKVLGV